MSTEQGFGSFGKMLAACVLSAGGDYILLLKTAALIILRFVLPLVLFTAALLLGFYLPGGTWSAKLVFSFASVVRAVLVLASVLYGFYLCIRFNGALGLALAYISIGKNSPVEIASLSYAAGSKFFWNSAYTGILLVFGQIIIICPCFILLSNFLFSPYLFVYEGLKGKRAEERSVELAKGFGWIVLSRTLAVMAIGYLSLALLAVLLFTKFFIIGAIIFVFANLYLALVQAHFIRAVYLRTVQLKLAGYLDPGGRFKAMTILAIVALLFFYIVLQVLPYVFHKF